MIPRTNCCFQSTYNSFNKPTSCTEKLAHCTFVAASILAGAKLGSLLTASAWIITLSATGGAIVSLIAIIGYKILTARYVETKEELHQAKPNEKLSLEKAKVARKYFDKQNYAEAFKYCDENDPAAKSFLGYMYFYGKDVEQNTEKAFALCNALKDSGDVLALYLLGQMNQTGKGTPQNYEQAFNFYRLAAIENYIPALSALAELYENGHGVNQDTEKASSYRDAVKQGNIIPQIMGIVKEMRIAEDERKTQELETKRKAQEQIEAEKKALEQQDVVKKQLEAAQKKDEPKQSQEIPKKANPEITNSSVSSKINILKKEIKDLQNSKNKLVVELEKTKLKFQKDLISYQTKTKQKLGEKAVPGFEKEYNELIILAHQIKEIEEKVANNIVSLKNTNEAIKKIKGISRSEALKINNEKEQEAKEKVLQLNKPTSLLAIKK